jgi:hypothetical protein
VTAAAAGAADAPPLDPDAARLAELGYPQELSRRLRFFDNAAIGFAAISPVVGLYAVIFVGTVVAGPAWVWVLPVALAGQCLLLAVYAELASEFPIAGGAYQWSRRLLGGAYGWFSGWVAICAYAVADTTIAYLGAPWALALAGVQASPNRIVLAGMLFVAVCAAAGAFGVGLLRWAIRLGIAAEVVASLGVGLVLLLVFRTQDVSVLGHMLGAEALSGGSVGASLLAALAVGGWVFIGFDACVGVSEETRDAGRHVPRTIWIALLSVAALVILDAVATTLAHPDPAAVVAGRDADPVQTAVVASFGAWSAKPFAAVVLGAFLACGIAAQSLTARAIYSIARDDLLPAAGVLAAAGAELGGGRQPDRVRHGRDLRRVPARRARGARGARPRKLGSRRQRAARSPGGRGDQPRGGRLAGLRDGQHRVAAQLARAPRSARLPDLGGTDRARDHRRGGPRLPRGGPAPASPRRRRGCRSRAVDRGLLTAAPGTCESTPTLNHERSRLFLLI